MSTTYAYPLSDTETLFATVFAGPDRHDGKPRTRISFMTISDHTEPREDTGYIPLHAVTMVRGFLAAWDTSMTGDERKAIILTQGWTEDY